jgi:hypothetical protein
LEMCPKNTNTGNIKVSQVRFIYIYQCYTRYLIVIPHKIDVRIIIFERPCHWGYRLYRSYRWYG